MNSVNKQSAVTEHYNGKSSHDMSMQAQRGGGGIVPSALEGVGDQHHVPAALLTGKTWYPMYRKLGGPRACLDGHG
jgi:hypothetical protein